MLSNGTEVNGVGSPPRNAAVNIKCGLCHEIFTRPKVLPCLHTFCQDCLEKTQEVADRLTCPTCRQECPLSAHGVAGLLADFAVSNLIEVSQGSNGDCSNKSCTGCKSKETAAVARCYDCSNYLCELCAYAHQFMHCFEGHRVINIMSEQNGKDCSLLTSRYEKQVACSHHKGELLQYFCKTCVVPACAECIATEHPKSLHDYEVLAECESKHVKHLSQYIHDFRMKSIDLHDVLKSFETASTKLHSQYIKAQNEVSEAFSFYRTLLDERKVELTKELENLYSTRQVTLSVVTQRVKETLDRMYQTVEFGDRLLHNASPPQILLFKKLLESRLQALLAAIPEPTLAMAAAAAGDLEFVANYSAMQAAVRNTLGYIRSGVTNGVESVTPGKLPPAPIARPTPGQVNGYHNGSQNGGHSNVSMSSNHTNGSASNGHGNGSIDSSMHSKRLTTNATPSSYNQLDLGGLSTYEKWSNAADASFQNCHKEFSANSVNDFLNSTPSSMHNNDTLMDITSKLIAPLVFPKTPSIKRQKMIYHCKFGEFGTAEAQFTEPSGVAVNATNEIIVADTNNHRIQIFDREGRFKFQFGECGKRDGKSSQLLYPNRVAVVKPSGDIVVTERSPTHQIQIYNQYGQFVRKFGANILQHPRGVTVDNKGRIIVVECKVMRVIIFDQTGAVLHKFGCSKHLEFPNGVVVNDRQEIFISDNRAHCVKVFSYEGTFLRQIGGEGLTNYPIGVGINSNGEILVADNHNNFNLTIFTQEGQLVSALESKVKHAQCFDVALMDDGSVVLASKDYRLYIYRYIQVPPMGL